jgi:hypothetical protein
VTRTVKLALRCSILVTSTLKTIGRWSEDDRNYKPKFPMKCQEKHCAFVSETLDNFLDIFYLILYYNFKHRLLFV